MANEQMKFLTEKRFTAMEMAQLFGVSKHTVERFLSPDIKKMHIFLPVHYTFCMELVRRICLNITTS